MREKTNFMKLAINLAKKGEGRVSPNPLVGAVVVKEGNIIGQGYHEYFGGPHAEVNAINNANESVEGADIYVNLEPCCHYGKTPPCTKLIIDSKIKRCIIGMKDPNPLVAGNGIKQLKEAGIEVICGILEEEARELNEVFINTVKSDRSYLFLKTALTLDGKIATKTGDSKWISNEKSREIVQKLRNKYSGILVGSKTIINDNPRLTARIENGVDPFRIVLDPKLETPLESNIIKNNSDRKTIIFTDFYVSEKKIEEFKKNNVIVMFFTAKDNKFDTEELLKATKRMNIDSILVEGGSEVISSFIKEKNVDSGVFFISPRLLGDSCSVPVLKGFDINSIKDGKRLKNVRYEIVDDNIAVWFKGVE